MTYHYNYTKTYEFTAFTGSDLTGGSLRCGDTFKMPANASVCIEVRDDDRALSGDSRHNENADDRSGQHAGISGAKDTEVGNGGQIYAESYFWVSDQHGNWYMLIEIEQEGSDESYYTFHTAYGMPRDGAHLKVGSQCNVTSDWIDYACLDAGEKAAPAGSISGRYFVDADCDNTEWNAETGAWEEGVEGQTVWLYDAHWNVVATTTTDAHGNYHFEGLSEGYYKVRFEPVEHADFVKADVGVWHADSDVTWAEYGKTDWICLGKGEHKTDIDAGVKPQTGSISGTVWCDLDCDGLQDTETRVEKGHNIIKDGNFANNDCSYFNIHEAGEWREVGARTSDVISGPTHDFPGNAHGNEFLELDCGGKIRQVVHTAEAGTYCLSFDVLKNVKIGDHDNTFQVWINGELVETVVVRRDGHVELEIDLDAGANSIVFVSKSGVDGKGAGIDTVELRELIETTTATEPGKEGVTVNLLDAHGTIVATTTTDAHGNYHFDKVPVGHYTIEGVAPDGTHFTIQDAGHDDGIDSDVGADGRSGTVTVTKNGHVDVDLGLCEKDGQPDPGSLSGRYFCDLNDNDVDDGEPGIEGVRVTLFDDAGNEVASALTAADGSYSFADLPPGTYSVVFTDPDNALGGKTLVDPNVGGDDAVDSDAIGDAALSRIDGIEVVAGQDTPDNDAGAEDPGTAEIRGRYFCDENRNDIDDGEAEPAIAGVAVTLLDGAGNTVATTTTDADGRYAFTGLAAGTYSVRFAPEPTGKTFVAQDAGIDDTVDSDVDPVTGETGPIVLAIGEISEDNDAGVEDPGTAALGDTVFFDDDADGLQDAGEVGVAGVTVTLTGAGQDGVFGTADDTTATEVTDADGKYLFTGLAAGAYIVTFAEPDGVDFTTQDAGDDALDSDADPATGQTGIYTLAIGETNLTVDAGVVAENGDPEPMDDQAVLCATESVTIDVLDNDGDPDGDPLIVAHIEGVEVVSGGSVTLGSGAVVTLNADGTLDYDSAGATYGGVAAADLLIGEQATDSFSYSVSDGNGGTATADVDIGICGAKNTLETIAAGDILPASLEMRVDRLFQTPIEEGYTIRTQSPDNGAALFEGAVFTEAYCLANDEAIVRGPYTPVNVYVATETLAAGSNLDADALEDLDLITWILNQDFGSRDNGEGGTYTETEIQAAIWNFTDQTTFLPEGTGTQENVQDIIEFALNDANFDGIADGGAEGYEAGEGDIVALVLDPILPSPTGHEQPFVIGVSFDSLAQDCACAVDDFMFV